uniref:Uncharacterized protein n=1 Tax=Sphaerodactylus townsendi TaxID=933632 RepID=A0ACB8EGY0_9SAUR
MQGKHKRSTGTNKAEAVGVLLCISPQQKRSRSCCDILSWGVVEKAAIPPSSAAKTEPKAAKTINHKALVSTNNFTKPPLAPKPKILSHFASKFPPSLSKSGTVLNSNSMSRGPKPPIAPKPKISNDSNPVIIQRSSVYANNTFNRCANGKLICTAGHLCEGNQCNTKYSELEAADEYIVISETDLTDRDYSDSEQLQEPEDGILGNPGTPADKEEDNYTDNEIYDFEINELQSNDSSYSTQPVDEDSFEPTDIQTLDSPEGIKQDAEYENVDCKIDPSVTENCCADGTDETVRELGLMKDNNEYNMDDKILNGEAILKDTICEDIILQHLEPTPASDDLPPICEDPGEEHSFQALEVKQPSVDTEMGATQNDGDESPLDIELELVEDVCESPTILANGSEEDGTGLELSGPESSTEGTLGEADNETDAEKEQEADPNADCETAIQPEEPIDDGHQTTELKSVEETSDTVCHTKENPEEQNDDVLESETADDNCQIIPFEKECSEDGPDSPEEDLPLEQRKMSDNCQPFALQDASGLECESLLAEESNLDAFLAGCTESALQDPEALNQMTEGERSDGGETAPETPNETSVEDTCCAIEELNKCHRSRTETNASSEYAIDESAAVPEVVVAYDKDEGETASDSLDNPYVLGDSLPLYVGKEVGEADVQYASSDFLEGGSMDTENHLLPIDRKSIVTRTRSLSGKVPGYVPETVPEETGPDTDLQPLNTTSLVSEDLSHSFSLLDGKPMELNRALPEKPRRFIFYPRSFSVEGKDIPGSVYRESDTSVMDYNRINRTEDLSLPCIIASSGSFSQRNHLPSSGLSTPSSVVDIPPPFELACITKKPITKSSPSLLIENESPDKYCKKKKSSFKKFLTLKFKKKSENKVHVDVHLSSSRSSSESSYHGPSRVVELDRRSLSSSPQLKSRTGKLRASESPTVLFYKDGKRKGTPKTFSRSVSRVESFEDRSRPPFMPLPLTKPRSISFPNADTSDYENIPAMNSDYENIQIPPRRPTRAGTFTEFFEDPSRALSAANENDGYVDMSSFTAFENNKQQPTNQETERYCNTHLCKTC